MKLLGLNLLKQIIFFSKVRFHTNVDITLFLNMIRRSILLFVYSLEIRYIFTIISFQNGKNK